MSLLILLSSILCLLVLILYFKLNAFLALFITAIATGLGAGMAPATLLASIQSGVGSTLGGLCTVLALGVMLGSILGETGAAQVIASRLLNLLGAKNAGLALLISGFIVGIAMFYNAGFVVMAPLAFSMARVANKPLLPLAIAMAAPLSVTHGFLPPHPAATAVANAFKADLGKMLILGLMLALPTILIAGLVFPLFLKKIPSNPPPGLFATAPIDPEHLPPLSLSVLIALLPVTLMALSAEAEMNLPEGSDYRIWMKFFGDPGISLLIAVLIALFAFTRGGKTLWTPALLIEKSSGALGAAANLLLVIAAGGAFKQVLVDSALGKDLATQLAQLPLSPLLTGWGIACVLRIAVGSATVAGMTAAGIVAPLLASSHASPELMALSIGAGSLMCSHVNDTGFWMFREWFGLSIRDTFLSWTLMETIIGLCGLAGVLVMENG